MKNEKSRPFKKGKKRPGRSDKRSKEWNPRPATAGVGETSGELADNFVFGFHATVEALQQGCGNKLSLREDARGEKIEQLKQAAKGQVVPVKWVSKAGLDTMSDHDVYRSMALTTTAYQYLTLEELLEQTKGKTETPFSLILGSLRDPHNSGPILQTADATGVDGIITPKHHVMGITPTVTKASTGAVEYILVTRVTNLVQGIATLKESQFRTSDTDTSGAGYRRWNTRGATVLIIRDEGRGMSQGSHKEMDELLTIPMTGHIQSLNVGVATGLLMYGIYRGRNPLQKKAIV